jgi:hypothetical protein
MSLEEEFDKIIRQKLEESAFPFDEKNWEKASRLLDEQRKIGGITTGKKYYYLAFSLLAVVAVGIFAISYTVSNRSDYTVISDNSTKLLAIVSSETTKREETKLLSNNKTKNSITPASDAVLKKSPTNADKVKNLIAQSSYIKNETTKSKSSVKGKTITPASMQVNSGSINPSKKTESIINTNEKTAFKIEQENNLETSKSNLVTEDLKGELITNEPITFITNTFPAYFSKQNIVLNRLNMFKHYDEDYYKSKNRKTHFLNIEAGACYLLGWDTKLGKDAKGFNWYGGLNYGIYFSKNVSVSAGVQVYNIAHIEQPFFTGSKTDYSFSSVTTNTTLTSNTLYYAAVPIKISYIINQQNKIGLGFNVGFLVNSKNKVETYTLLDNGKINNVVTNNTGVYKGTNTRNMLLNAFYTTQLTNRIGVNVEFVYGISDIFDNTNTINNTENSVGLRLSLQYTLFNK